MALYEGFDMTFVKMPQYLHTNIYQNKDRLPVGLTSLAGRRYNSIYSICIFAAVLGSRHRSFFGLPSFGSLMKENDMPYRLLHQQGAARRGEFVPVHGTVQTPAFMNVATAAAIKGGLAGSTVMNAKAPMMIEGNDKPGFKIDLHIKDLNNALDCAHTVGSPLPMTAAVQEIFQWLHNNGCGQDDHSSIIKYYKKLTGIESL